MNDKNVVITNTLPDIPEKMRELDWFLGRWDVLSRFDRGADKGGMLEERCVAIHKPVLNGHVILENFIGPLFEGGFEAWSLRKYNPNAERWEQRWVDTSPGGFADWTGSYDPATHTFTGYANRGRDDDGNLKETAVREVFFDIELARFHWKLERTTDNGQTWSVIWTLDYTRQT